MKTAMVAILILAASFGLQWAAIHAALELWQMGFVYDMEPQYFHSLSATGILWLVRSVL